MEIKTKYYFGQLVYLISDSYQLERMITGIQIRPTGCQYALSEGVNETWHYEIEISEKRNIIKATSS